MNPEQEILVVPRSCLTGRGRFIRGDPANQLVDSLAPTCRWMPRREAELSGEWIQAIPVALMMNREGQCCILRRTRETRSDLEDRLTLVVGGHVDRHENTRNFHELLLETLLRELDEEVGVTSDSEPKLLGVVIDNSSVLASRHVAFLFLILTEQSVQANAPEEFAKHSKYSGRFLSVRELLDLRSRFDPWSTVVIEDYLAPSEGVSIHRQPRLPLPLAE